MPQRAPSACRRPGCPGLVRNGVCSVCGALKRQVQRQHNEQRGTATQRGYDGRWQRLRLMHLRSHPLCTMCASKGRVTPATDVDHIIPKRWGGKDVDENFSSLCHACHSHKTGMEKYRERWKGTRMAHVVVVGGPPGAGKTYYVHQRMKEGDVVLDVDAIVAALTGRPWYDFTPEQLRLALDVREFLLLRLRYPTDVWTAWVITSAASASARGSIVEQCGAQETIMLLEPVAICMNRIRSDKRRAGTLSRWDLVVNQWWMDYEAIEGETVCVGSPGRGRPISGDPDV